jgi:hypothetical protein
MKPTASLRGVERGANQCPGSFLYIKEIKLDDSVRLSKQVVDQAEMNRA